MIPCFFKLDFTQGQCKTICIAIITMNINPAHSWRPIKKCLKETQKLPRPSYPLGNTSQFIKPVLNKKTKRRKEILLTIHNFEDLPLDILVLMPPVLQIPLSGFLARFENNLKDNLNLQGVEPIYQILRYRAMVITLKFSLSIGRSRNCGCP